MGINLLKAIKSTHRNPDSKILHLIGLSLYVVGFILITGYYYFSNLNISSPIYGIILFPIAVGLFLLGHKKEGNLRAMTIIVIINIIIKLEILPVQRTGKYDTSLELCSTPLFKTKKYTIEKHWCAALFENHILLKT